jgi:hypothetical protein
VPRPLARRLGRCEIFLAGELTGEAGEPLTSQWREAGGSVQITLATADTAHHDLALELLVCLGQVLWERTTPGEREACWKILTAELEAGVAGEIGETALTEKRQLLSSPVSARSRRRFERYARASFAETVAEYVHCLWHDVTVRSGPEHLPAHALRRRLETLAQWFPPNPGYRLFAASAKPRRTIPL